MTNKIDNRNRNYNKVYISKIANSKINTKKAEVEYTNPDTMVTTIIKVKSMLTFDEMTGFVNSVVNAICNENGYTPVVEKIALIRATLAYYTNLEFDYKNENITMNLLYNTTLYDDILDKINSKQYEDMLNAISVAVDYKLQSNVSAIEQKYKDLSVIFENEQKELMSQMEKLVEVFGKIGENFNSNEIKLLVEKIANKDETEIAKEVLNVANEKTSNFA